MSRYTDKLIRPISPSMLFALQDIKYGVRWIPDSQTYPHFTRTTLRALLDRKLVTTVLTQEGYYWFPTAEGCAVLKGKKPYLPRS